MSTITDEELIDLSEVIRKPHNSNQVMREFEIAYQNTREKHGNWSEDGDFRRYDAICSLIDNHNLSRQEILSMTHEQRLTYLYLFNKHSR